MSKFAELAKFYARHGYYKRERRPFIDRKYLPGSYRPAPDTSLLKPEDEHRISGPRTGWMDKIKGVIGYFYGGGWVFGFVENKYFRAESSGFVDYEATQKLELPFRAGDVAGTKWKSVVLEPGVELPKREDIPGDKFIQVTVKRGSYGDIGPMIPPENLRVMDRLALEHDRALRSRDELVWAGTIKRKGAEYDALSKSANGALRQGLKAIDWRKLKKDWKRAKDELSKTSWEGMGSLLAYEKSVARFSIWVLGFDSRDDVAFMAPLEQLTPFVFEAMTTEEDAVSDKQAGYLVDKINQHYAKYEEMRVEAEDFFIDGNEQEDGMQE